jgi:glycosyltransferase involved in cell wall biosynthesis
MRVTVSCAGRFHAYDLAGQLEKRNLLHRLITTYPKSKINEFGVPSKKAVSLLYWELANRGWSKFAARLGLNRVSLQFALAELFDKSANPFIPKNTDVYIGWSSHSERGLVRAKQYGAITILERGSAHIQVQTEILNREYSEYGTGVNPLFTHPKIIEKELREYELADFISVPSSFVKRSFLQMGVPAHKLIQNVYGVNLSQFKPLPFPAHSVFRVIFVGQLSLRKGIHFLLQAIDELKLPDLELLLIGGKNPDIDPYLLKYKNRFRYIGKIPQQQLNLYYSQSDVFCLPSVDEGFAMVQAQAMACALPVICTTNTGGEDVIEDGVEGFVIPIRSVEKIKEKISWLYSNRDACKKMGINARAKIINGYTWDDYGQRYIGNLMQIRA